MPNFDLSPFIDHTPSWLLVLFRLTGIFVLAPMLGSSTIPRQVKLFLALGTSLCVYPMLLDPLQPSSPAVVGLVAQGLELWTLLGLIAMELLVGFVVGYAASLPLVGMQMGGQIIDQQLGISFAGVVNPELNEEAGIIGRFFFMTALAIFAGVGGAQVMLGTLIGSFDKIPLGGFATEIGFGPLLDFILALLAIVFEMALRIAAPVLCLMFLIMTGLGFIARTVPQMNILSIGFVIRILMGAMMLIFGITIVMGVFGDTLQQTFRMMLTFFAYER